MKKIDRVDELKTKWFKDLCTFPFVQRSLYSLKTRWKYNLLDRRMK